MRYIVAAVACGALFAAESFAPADVAILGDLDYGATSEPLDCPGTQKYCAVVFNGMSGDNVEVAANGGEGKPFVAIADGRLAELAHGAGSVTTKLPQVKDDLATYYIVFRDSQGKPGKFKLTLKKVE